jgi:uncharacterized membrane protein
MARPNEVRPILKLPRSPLENWLEAIALAGLAYTMWIVAGNWSQLPARLPRHFNGAGQADAWGSRGDLLVPVVISILVHALLTAVSLFPHKGNFLQPITAENAERQYRLMRRLLAVVKIEMAALFAYILTQTIRTAFGTASGLGMGFLPVMLITSMCTLVVYCYLAARAR